MRSIKYLTCLFLIFLSLNVYAQLSTNEKPISFSMKLDTSEGKTSTIRTITTPVLDMAKIEAEDKEDEKYDMPPRFGYPHKVNYDLINSGTWYTLPNGDKLWQLNVICPNALSVNFSYDKFWIPEGGKFFVYSKDKKHSIGAFTSRNNKGSREQPRGFATGLVYGDNVMLEYYQPKEATSDAIISLKYIIHGYKYINIGEKNLGSSGSCQVNVNCEEGQDWQKEKKAVAMILVGNHRLCTGALINTTSLSKEPLFLTANHCIDSYGDATEDADLDDFSFYWNYEAPGCANVSVEPTYFSTDGATILANNSISDFALLRLTEDPQELSNYTPYYLGWDSSGQSGHPEACIHHPSGDVKKISKVDSLSVKSTYYSLYTESESGNHWKVTWRVTPNGHGTTEGGSSGSPLLNATHKVIGQLHGGYANCGDSISAPDWYGKFDVSWTGNGNSSIYRRLNCWLNSINSETQTLEGLLIIPTIQVINTDQQLYCNIRITSSGQLTVQSDVEFSGNCKIIVEAGGKLIVDSGALLNVDIVLYSGASLQIINDGIIETINGLDASLGATVDIIEGAIN